MDTSLHISNPFECGFAPWGVLSEVTPLGSNWGRQFWTQFEWDWTVGRPFNYCVKSQLYVGNWRSEASREHGDQYKVLMISLFWPPHLPSITSFGMIPLGWQTPHPLLLCAFSTYDKSLITLGHV